MTLPYETPFCVEWTNNSHAEEKKERHFADYAEAKEWYLQRLDDHRHVYFWEIGSFQNSHGKVADEWFCFMWKDDTYDDRVRGRGEGLRVNSMKGLWGYKPYSVGGTRAGRLA